MARTVAALALALVFACTATVDVDWENYAPGVKERIDAEANNPEGTDCNMLQAMLEMAKVNDPDQREEAGDGNEDLMACINAQAEAAGCFPEGAEPFS